MPRSLGSLQELVQLADVPRYATQCGVSLALEEICRPLEGREEAAELVERVPLVVREVHLSIVPVLAPVHSLHNSFSKLEQSANHVES